MLRLHALGISMRNAMARCGHFVGVGLKQSSLISQTKKHE